MAFQLLYGAEMLCRKAAGVTGVKQNTHHFFNGQIAVAYRHGIQLAGLRP